MIVLLLSLSARAQDVLPVQRVRFYEGGVAWFERSGTVRDATALPLPRSHLDDALKTLVLLGGDVELGAVSFASARPEDAATELAGWGATPGYQDALSTLRGSEVAATTADERRHVGRLIQVEGPLAVHGDEGPARAMVEEYAITLLTADGALQRLLTSELSSLQSTDAGTTARLWEATAALSGGDARRAESLDVQLRQGGSLSLGYLAEAPVYRLTYRLSAPQDGVSALQAWALVHNDTDEPWSGVQVELVNGQPDSFLFPLTAPRYAERQLVTPDTYLPAVPQLARATADGLWDDDQVIGGIGTRGYGSGATGYGSGRGALGVGGIVEPAVALQEAEAVETPTQFLYRVAQPVDLAPHHSALVPVVAQDIDAETAVVVHNGAARLGLWVTNSTRRTLPAGLVAVLEAGGLGGEAFLERMKPDEAQLVRYGTEVDVDPVVRWEHGTASERGLWWDEDAVVVRAITPRTATVEVANRSGRARQLWLPIELRVDDTVVSEVRTEIDRHNTQAYAVLDAPTGTSEQAVTLERHAEQRQDPTTLAADTYRRWAEEGLAEPTVLRSAAEARSQLAQTQSRQQQVRADLTRTETHLTSLREGLAAATDGGAVLARRVAASEQEAHRLRERLASLEDTAEQQASQLREVLSRLPPWRRAQAAR